MSIALKMNYEFELDGKVYEAKGADFGETEKESDIADINSDIDGLKSSAICHAFDLTIDEYEQKKSDFTSVKFNYVEVFS